MHGARPMRSTRRLSNVLPQLPKWYNIAPVADGPTLVSIFDEIGMLGVSAAQFVADLKGIAGDLEVHISSPGGDIYDGLTIYNTLLQARKRGTVNVIIDGLAASAASFIAMAASPGKLEISPHAEVMIHDGFCLAIGNAADMRELADQLDRASDNIAGIYADRTGKPAAYWREKMRAETWFTDRQAVDEGLADRIHGQETTPENLWDLSVFARYADVPPVRDAAPVHEPVSGSHSHAGPSGQAPRLHSHDGDASHEGVFDPDQDGDDDSSAEGDTDHDYVLPDGKPGPKAGNKAAFPVLAADVDHSAWDASRAWKAGAASDDPAAFYRGICAGRRAGDPATQAAWALPYRYSPKSPPNAAGVRDALSRLPQVHGLTNADEARRTLEAAMKEVNPDYEPDDCIDPGLLAAVLANGLEGARK